MLSPAMFAENQTSLPTSVRDFILHVLRARWDSSALDAAHALGGESGFDWDQFEQVAHSEGVAPLAYSVLKKENILPALVEERLRQEFFLTGARNIRALTELAQLLGALSDAGIPVILLKGAALIALIYHNPALRPMADLDLLLRPGDIAAALAVLERRDYGRTQPEVAPESTLAFESQIQLRHRGSRLLVELHWSLFDSPYYQETLPPDWGWQTAIVTDMGETQAMTLPPTTQLIHLCAHLWLHHQGRGLLWWHDIAELVAHSLIDWEQVLDQSQKLELILPLQNTTQLMVSTWHVSIPPAIQATIERLQASVQEIQVFGKLTAPDRSPRQRFWDDLSMMRSRAQQLRFVRDMVFPSPDYMRRRYGMRNGILLPWYYLYRWLRGLKDQ